MWFCALALLAAPGIVLAVYPAQSGIVVQETVILTDTIPETLIVNDGGVLTLLGVGAQDVTVQPGGVAYIHGMVVGNVLNYGGYLEVYGIVGGYVHTDGGGVTIVDPDAIVLGSPPVVPPTPLPPVDPIVPTPTPISTPIPLVTPAPEVGMIDLSVSLYRSASTPAEREPYEDILGHFADAIYEMTNGAHRVRTVTVYQNGQNARTADIVWVAQEWPSAYPNGYAVPGYGVYMGDWFNATDFTVERRCGGYVLAHEWGHYYYGLYDEYRSGVGNSCPVSDLGCPRPDDTPVRNSVMNDTWRACYDEDYNWLNFSIPKNQTRNNAQFRVFNASAWEMLARPPSQDPREAARWAVRPRTYFPELANAAPLGNSDASLELILADASLQARSELSVVWANGTASTGPGAPSASALPSSAASASGPINLAYQGKIESVLGDALEYPEPLLLVARVVEGLPIANAGINAGVLAPDGNVYAIPLHDDGLAPDVLADDGLYSGFVPYTQAGVYYVFARFDNLAGLAEFTAESREHAIGPDGETDYPRPHLVDEDFFAVANAIITVDNVRSDDHGNTPADATFLATDNVDIIGRIDYPTDVDMFVVTPTTNGKLVLRLSRFAFDMQPRIQVLGTDGARILKTFEFAPTENEYFFTPLRVRANETFYVAVEHLDPSAVGGMYDISIGPALPNVIESPPFNFLLLLIPLIGGGLLTALYLLRPRPAPRQVAMPRRRRDSTVQPTRRMPTLEARGSSIYKQAEDAVDEDLE